MSSSNDERLAQGGADRTRRDFFDVLDEGCTTFLDGHEAYRAWYCSRFNQPPRLAQPPERPRGDAMMGSSGYDFSDTGTGMVDPMSLSLPKTPPATWTEREDRVRWCRENLTPGERALIVKLSYDVDNVKRADCDAVIAKERKGLVS